MALVGTNMAKSIDRCGEEYGDFKIISKAETLRNPGGSYVARWEVECIHCGFVKVSAFKNLNGKNNPTCKCMLRKKLSDTAKKNQRKGTKNIPGAYFYSLKSTAERRNIEFDITIEFLQYLLEEQEFKCKLSNEDISMSPDNSRHLNGKCLDTASVDRIDSSKGYIPSNVQWVHKDVNFMKMNLKESRFIDLCRKIGGECGS